MESTAAQLYPTTRYWLIGTLLFCLIGLASLIHPLFLLAWAPLLLGPIHILYDIRYLVIKPAWYLDRRWWLVCALPLILSIYFGPMCAWLSLMGATLFFAKSWLQRSIGFLISIVGLIQIHANAFLWGYVALYLHNLVTVFLWLKFKNDLGKKGYLFLFGTVAFSLLILSGICDPLLTHFHFIIGQKNWEEATSLVASHLQSAMATRMAVVYVFLQMIHYLVWLYLIPKSPTSSLRASAAGEAIQNSQSLDCRVTRLWRVPRNDIFMYTGAALVTLALVFYGYSHVWDARLLYLKIGGFHVYLEVAMLLLFYLTGKGPRAFQLA